VGFIFALEAELGSTLAIDFGVMVILSFFDYNVTLWTGGDLDIAVYILFRVMMKVTLIEGAIGFIKNFP